MTVIELMVAFSLLFLALLGFTKVIVFSTKTTDVQHDSILAREAARETIEILQAAEFSDLFALYNVDDTDDPGGFGTAPGADVEVNGLVTAAGSAVVGRIMFPTLVDDTGDLQVREDVNDPALGMPRDLNGDGVIDSDDHSHDYLLLPVRVTFEWEGKAGPAELELRTLLADY